MPEGRAFAKKAMSARVGVIAGWGATDARRLAAASGDGLEIVLVVPPGDAVAEAMGRQLEGTCEVIDPDSAVKRSDLSGVITFADDHLRLTTRIAETLELPRWHGTDVVEGLADKLTQRERLAAITPVRFSRLPVNGRLRCLPPPVVFKLRSGTGGLGLRRATTEREVDEVLGELQHNGLVDLYLVEEEIDGLGRHPAGRLGLADYVSVETCTVSGETTVLGIGDKTTMVSSFRETGVLYPSTLPADWCSAVEELAISSLVQLGVTSGLCHVEIKLTEQGPRIIEVNGRLGGGVAACFPYAYGLDPVRFALQLAAGTPKADAYAIASTDGPRSAVGQLLLTPPHGCHEVRSLPARSDIRQLSGVVAYAQYTRPGDILDSSAGQRSITGEVILTGDTPDDVLDCLEAVKQAVARASVFSAVAG